MKPQTAEVDPRYSAPDAKAPEWDVIAAELTDTEVYGLTTVLPDGTPHTVPVTGAFFADGFAFCTGEHEQKARNLGASPRASVHVGSTQFSEGKDIVLRGDLVQVRDAESLSRLADTFEAKYPDFFRFQVGEDALINAHGNRAVVLRMKPECAYVFTRGANTAQVKYTF